MAHSNGELSTFEQGPAEALAALESEVTMMAEPIAAQTAVADLGDQRSRPNRRTVALAAGALLAAGGTVAATAEPVAAAIAHADSSTPNDFNIWGVCDPAQNYGMGAAVYAVNPYHGVVSYSISFYAGDQLAASGTGSLEQTSNSQDLGPDDDSVRTYKAVVTATGSAVTTPNHVATATLAEVCPTDPTATTSPTTAPTTPAPTTPAPTETAPASPTVDPTTPPPAPAPSSELPSTVAPTVTPPKPQTLDVMRKNQNPRAVISRATAAVLGRMHIGVGYRDTTSAKDKANFTKHHVRTHAVTNGPTYEEDIFQPVKVGTGKKAHTVLKLVAKKMVNGTTALNSLLTPNAKKHQTAQLVIPEHLTK